MPANMDIYLHQWLETAGNFQLDLAWQTNRAQVRCKCGAILRFDQPQVNGAAPAPAIPWVLQDWVVKHGKNGPHDKPIPITADFKSPPKLNTAKITQGRRFR